MSNKTIIGNNWDDCYVLFVEGDDSAVSSALSRVAEDFSQRVGVTHPVETLEELRGRIEEAGRLSGPTLFVLEAAPEESDESDEMVEHVLRLGRSTGLRLALPAGHQDGSAERGWGSFAEKVNRIDAGTV